MDMEKLYERLVAKMDADQAKAEVERKKDEEEMDVIRKTDRQEMLARMDSGQEQIQENLKRIIEETMIVNQARTDVQLKDLTERIEKTQRELQSSEVSLCARTTKLQEDLTKNYNKTCKRIEETKREFQARWDDTRQTRAEGANTAGSGTCSAQPPTFDGNTTWSVFRQQFEVVAEHN
jgi:hypothetical protein